MYSFWIKWPNANIVVYGNLMGECNLKVVMWHYVRRRLADHSVIWTASSEFGTYRLCEQRRFRRTCASAQSRQNLRCSLIQTVSQEEPSDRKPDPWPLWMTGHAQLKFVMTECSTTQIRLTGLIWCWRRAFCIWNEPFQSLWDARPYVYIYLKFVYLFIE